MGGINPQKLSESLVRAKDLINSEEFNKKVDSLKNKQISYDDNMPYYGSSQRENKIPINISNIPKERFAESKLPKEIVNDIMDNPIDINGSSSILDSILPTDTYQPKVNENTIKQTNAVLNYPIQQSPMIDYSLIKTIIDESVKRNISEMKKTMITESNVSLMRITNGNKIQVVDAKGNLYEGILKLKGNIKSNK